jgi:hypothetical protein
LPDFNGAWDWFDSGEFRVTEFSWGQGLSGKASYGPGEAWNASLELKDADSKPLALLLKKDPGIFHQGLNASAQAKVQGSSGDLALRIGSSAEGHLGWAPGTNGERLFKGEAHLKDMELERLLEWMAFAGLEAAKPASQQWSGLASAQMDLDSSQATPLSFSASVSKLKQPDWDWGGLTLSGQAAKDMLKLSSLELGFPDNHLALSATTLRKAYDGALVADTQYQARNFPDSAFFRFGGQGSIHGVFKTGASRTELHWKSMAINQATFGPGAASFDWKERLLSVQDLAAAPRYRAELSVPLKGDPKLELCKVLLDKNGTFEAHHALDEDGKQRLELSGHGVDLGVLGGVLDWDVSLGGQVYGNAVFRGPEGPNGHMRLLASAKIENGNLQGFPFDLATGSVSMENGRLILNPLGEPVHVTRKNRYEAEVKGSIPLDTDQPGKAPEQIDMQAKLISGNLGLFDFLDVVDSATGTVTAEASIRGTARYPEYNGKLEVHGGTMKFKRVLGQATDLQAQVFVEQNKLQILRVDAQVGKTGQRLYVDHGPNGDAAMTFDRWVISDFNFHFNSGKSGIHVSGNENYDFITGSIFPDLILGGNWDRPSFGGTVSLADLSITYPIVDKDNKPTDPHDFSQRLQWDLVAKPASNVVFVNDVAHVELKPDDKGLHLYGPGSDLVLEGTVRPLRGKLAFYSSDFQIDDSRDNRVDFHGQDPPYLQLWAQKSVRSAQGFDTPINLTLTGSLDGVQPGLSSPDTELTHEQIVAMAGLDVDPTSSNAVSKGLGSMAGKFLIRKLFGLFSRRYGVSNLDLSVRAPVLGKLITGSSNSASATADSLGNTANGEDLGEVNVGTYLPLKFYGSAGVVVKENPKGGTDPVYKAGLQHDLGKNRQIEYSYNGEENENKLLLKAHDTMDNYDPRKRRAELELARERRRTRAASPLATMTPTLTPAPAQTPALVPENP